MQDSLSIELFLMGVANARGGLSLSLAWPEAMQDGWNWVNAQCGGHVEKRMKTNVDSATRDLDLF